MCEREVVPNVGKIEKGDERRKSKITFKLRYKIMGWQSHKRALILPPLKESSKMPGQAADSRIRKCRVCWETQKT